MRKPLVIITALSLAGYASASLAATQAKVVSVTPVVAQIAVPHQLCADVQQMVQPRSSGMGALVGALVGAAAGHGVGSGSGKALATGIGMVAGAAVGDQVETRSNQPYAQTVRQCQQQLSYENRVVAYNVVYEFAGQQYQTQMTQKPGNTISVDVNVTPTDETQPAPTSQAPMSTAPLAAAPVLANPPVIYAQPAWVAQQPVYAPPVVIGVQGGYWGGYRHHSYWR